MRKIVTIISIMVFAKAFLYSQNTLLLEFNAQESTTGLGLDLDSVQVRNLDKNCDTILYGAAPSLLLDIISGLGANQLTERGNVTIIPNPFENNSQISIHLNSQAEVQFKIFNLQGRLLHRITQKCIPETTTFHLETSEHLTYIAIQAPNLRNSFLLINHSPGNNNNIVSSGHTKSQLKQEQLLTGFLFEMGDQLRMTGYATDFLPDTLFDSPIENTQYTFLMEEPPPPSPPEVLTLNATSIMHTEVVAGGHVFNDGGLTLTARGLCWSIDPEPNLQDNFSMEGQGTGAFSSTMNNLDTNTVYFFRAYATNDLGTAYGEEMSFTSKSDIPCPGLETITHGGQVYETVLIGSQCWIKENMNIGVMILDSQDPEDNGVIEKWCYSDIEGNCDQYGGLYNWYEAMQYDSIEGAQGICPEGWHIPTDEDFLLLEGTVDSQYPIGDPIWVDEWIRGYDAGYNIKYTSGWNNNGNGSDVYGYSALAAGFKLIFSGFTALGDECHIWTSTGSNFGNILNRDLRSVYDEILVWDASKEQGFSVRCIHNDSF